MVLWCFGIIGCWIWLTFKKECSQFLAFLRIVRTVSCGLLQGFMAQTMRRDRECFLEELGVIKGLWNGSWCVAGGFNAILSPEECGRGGSLNSNMRRFLEVIEDLELKDLPLVEGPFT